MEQTTILIRKRDPSVTLRPRTPTPKKFKKVGKGSSTTDIVHKDREKVFIKKKKDQGRGSTTPKRGHGCPLIKTTEN